MNDINIKAQLAPGWSPVNIGIIVILYFAAWPLALLMVAYIIWGHKAGLDLSQPATFGNLASRLGVAWRAALTSFKNSDKP